MPRAAQQLPERQPGSLGVDVPQRDVDCRLRHRRRARAPDPVRLAEVELLPDLADVSRIRAEEVVDEERVEDLPDDAAAVPDRDRVSRAGDARISRDREGGELEVRDELHAVGDAAADRHAQQEAFGAGDLQVLRFTGGGVIG